MTTAGTIGGTAGGVAGQALGAVIGGFLGGPVGAWVGRAVGGRLGRMAGAAVGEMIAESMEDANEDAETETKDAAVAEENCKTCKRDDCIELEKKMKEEMYANKRAPGGQGKHGLNLRRAEQICGANGPGTDSWDNHMKEIQRGQTRLDRLLREYDQKQCKGHPDQNINLDEARRMRDRSFNPSPGDWLGPNHPSCSGLKDLIQQNPTPELPKFPKPPKTGGIPTS